MSDSLLNSIRSLSGGTPLDFDNSVLQFKTWENNELTTDFPVGTVVVMSGDANGGTGPDMIAKEGSSSGSLLFSISSNSYHNGVIAILFRDSATTCKSIYGNLATSAGSSHMGTVAQVKTHSYSSSSIYLYVSENGSNCIVKIPPPKWMYLLILCTPFDFNARKCA